MLDKNPRSGKTAANAVEEKRAGNSENLNVRITHRFKEVDFVITPRLQIR